MRLPSVNELVSTYSQSRASDIGRVEHQIIQKHGLEALIPLLIETYPQLRRSAGRASILFWLVGFARTHQAVIALATSALLDRAFLVRERACSILAYSLRPDVLPQLVRLQTHEDLRTRADAAAAIDAISNRNHHYYVDRTHTGKTFWGVNPGDVPGGP
jgi:hypothetical protein